MRIRTTIDVGRIASQGFGSVRNASVIATPVERKTKKELKEEHGQNIFVYSHLQTKQVVYSLTRGIKNNHALRQLPYNGKKTVPRALRKDLWSPLAQISLSKSIPNASALGLLTFQKLREFRTLHETLWPTELAITKVTRREEKALQERAEELGEKTWKKEGDDRILSRKERGRLLMNQRSNAVADMAAALQLVVGGVPTGKTEGEVKAVDGETEVKPHTGEPKVIVKWTDLLDAEFAASWPDTVAHDIWEPTRNNRRAPSLFEEDEFATPEEDTTLLQKNKAEKVVL